MSSFTVRIVSSEGEEHIPSYTTSGSAGVDLRAAEEGRILCGEWKLVSTGLKMEIPKGYEGQVRPRSGLALKHGVTVLNSPGTIDSDYRGDIGVILMNNSAQTFVYEKGDRIAQMVFAKTERAVFEHVETLEDTDRASGGFGHSGVK
ncbi:dUTP diphosphatase [Limisalsivibrio acetivorans]|uniref:dUTP diphosphatase n=1 Tax=Limisalsivibrio acetivorans TaxID=1304888 RepID=UPI0003B4DEC8|nr:dUTP diphosphatase [Limisalsivibrio acetivorans]